jgi:chromosome segregation ATPase
LGKAVVEALQMSNDHMSTTPTIETLLERMNEWGEKFSSELKDLKTGQEELRNSVEELRKGQEELRKGQEELQSQLNTGLRRVERKIEILNDNLLAVRADIRDLEVRVEKLESGSLTKS